MALDQTRFQRIRLQLHEELKSILGNSNAYYRKPPSQGMRYPCIVYERSPDMARHADNVNFVSHAKFTLTYISRTPDDSVVDDIIEKYPYSYVDRYFETDNLNHTVIILYKGDKQ